MIRRPNRSPALALSALLCGLATEPVRPRIRGEAEDPTLRLAERLIDAPREEREELYRALLERDRPRLLEVALLGRSGRAERALREGSTLAELEKLAAVRRALDDARQAALGLILDREEYFRPGRAPDDPPQRVALYAAVQERVDRLVERVERLWDHPRSVVLPADFRAAIEDLRWCRQGLQRAGHEAPAPPGLAGFLWSLPLDAPQVDLHGFVWDAEERGRLAFAAAVREHNRRLWSWAAGVTDRYVHPDPEEIEMVRLVNRYRERLGRDPMAWNPLLQEAAHMHSIQMHETGELGHLEPDARRHTHDARIRLTGYPHPGSENTSQGNVDAPSTLRGWLDSSGHHRSLLEELHREVGVARVGLFWTQVFGKGVAFRDELEPWRD